MPMAKSQTYAQSQETSNNNFKGTTYVIVPNGPKEDTFTSWAAKNILTASAFSLAWDLGTNACAKFSSTIEPVTLKQMFKNIPQIAGVFLLIGGIFKAVSHLIDNHR